ncbi:MAG TPA: hypothetical protein DCS93_30005 [Microscillaceae bacterium]|nr:hypothetical protein [Microscillaceae bacterium]
MNILVPFDFSEQAQNALKVAKTLAQKNSSKVILFHVIEPIMAQSGTHPEFRVDTSQEEYFNRMVEATRVNLDNAANSAQDDYVKVEAVVEIGGFLTSIKNYATKENDIRLIVSGTAGSKGLEEVLVGTNTEKMVRHLTCPVLTIPNEVESFETNNVLFATNLSDEQLIPLNRLQQLQGLWGNHIHLLFVNTPNDFLSTKEVIKKKEEFLRRSGLRNYTFHEYADHTQEVGIVNAANDLDVDMIVIPTHQRKGLWHFFLGSIAEGVVNHAEKPVLTVNMKLMQELS